MIDQIPGNDLAYFQSRVINGSQLWLNDFADHIIIESNHRNIFRHAYACFLEGLYTNSCTKIIGKKDPIGSWLHFDNLFGCTNAGFLCEINDKNHFLIVL